MVRPTARVLALLEILQGGGTFTAADLAERLGLDERTVRRHVAHLVDLDIPVESLRGRYGGYRLAAGYRLPPLMLNDEEAVAVLVALARARPGRTTARHAVESAAAKIRRVLPRRLEATAGALFDVADLAELADPADPAGVDPADAVPGTPATVRPLDVDVLLVVAQAARQRRSIEVAYTDRDGAESGRTIEPYGLVAHRGRWYVTGRDAGRGAVRTFRLDRITSVRTQPDTFEVPTGFRPRAVVLDALARAPWRFEVAVRAQADVDVLAARLPSGVATLRPLPDQPGWTKIEIRAERLDWVPGVLASLGTDVVVDAPDELRERVLALGQRLVAAAGRSTPRGPDEHDLTTRRTAGPR